MKGLKPAEIKCWSQVLTTFIALRAVALPKNIDKFSESQSLVYSHISTSLTSNFCKTIISLLENTGSAVEDAVAYSFK